MKFFKKLLAISLASITLVSCGSKPKSISCNTTSSFWFSGAKLSYSINTNKIVINSVDPDTGKPYKVTIPIEGESIKIFNETFPVTFEDSTLFINDYDLQGSVPLDSCPTNTPEVIEGLVIVYAMAEAISEMSL